MNKTPPLLHLEVEGETVLAWDLTDGSSEPTYLVEHDDKDEFGVKFAVYKESDLEVVDE
jgi:hypothetical protein